MEKKTIIVIAVVVAVLIVIGGGLSVMVGVGKSIVEDKGTLEAETYTVDKLSTSFGWKTASTGNVYVLAMVTITNDKASDGISNNCYYVEMKAGGVTYTHDGSTYSILHEDAYVLKDIGIGVSSTSCYVFQIPEGVVSTAEVAYNGGYNLSCKTVYKGETTMKANITYDAVASTQYIYDLMDGTIWSPKADYKFLELKITYTCNFEKVSLSYFDWDVTVGGKSYYMASQSSQIIVDPYIKAELTKGQTVTLTQVYQVPIGSDMSMVKIAWDDSSETAEGKISFVDTTASLL